MFLLVYLKKLYMLLGIGEKVREINHSLKLFFVIIKPNRKDFFKTSTKEMYEKLDNSSEIKQEFNSKFVENVFLEGKIFNLCGKLYNVFEESVKECKIVDSIKNELKENGSIDSLMTGSRFLYFWGI